MSDQDQAILTDEQIVVLSLEFEDRWNAGNPCDYNYFLRQVPRVNRGQLFKVLVEIDHERRVQVNQKLDPADFKPFGRQAIEFVEKLQASPNSPSTQKRVAREADTSYPLNCPSAFLVKSDQVGPYHLIRELGTGGMGTVWLAEQHEPVKRKVAIKLIDRKVKSAEVISRFRRERQSLALMQHQNIARILDAGELDSETPYFVMEWVAGQSITEYCDRNQLSIKKRIELFIDVCRAVDHAHEKGVIHRDIKPSNILVQEQDGLPIVKIIDFGLVKTLQAPLNVDESLQTHSGMLLGTVIYMSPEQAGFQASIGRTADVYSLGIVLYELLTGETPIRSNELQDRSILDVLELIRNRETKPASRVIDSLDDNSPIPANRGTTRSRLKSLLSGDIDNILRMATEKKPADRYATAKDLADDVVRFLNFESVVAHGYSPTYRIKRYVQRNRQLIGFLVTVSILLTLGLIGTISYAVKAVYAETEATLAAKQANREKEEKAIALANAQFVISQGQWSNRKAKEAVTTLFQIDPQFRGPEWDLAFSQYQGSRKTSYEAESELQSVAYSPDGTRIAAGSLLGKIHLYDSETATRQMTLEGHQGLVTGLLFNQAGDELVSIGFDKTVRFWNLASRLQTHSVKLKGNLIIDIATTGDRKNFAIIGHHGFVRIWDFESRKRVRSFASGGVNHGSIAMSQDGNRIATGGGSYVNIIDATTGKRIKRFRHGYSVRALAFDPTGKYVAASGNEPSVTVWDIEKGSLLVRFRHHKESVDSVEFDPSGRFIVSAARDHSAVVWDLRSRRMWRMLVGHVRSVSAATFHPSKPELTTVSDDGTLKSWKFNHPNNWDQQKMHSDRVWSLEVHPNGKLIASGGWDDKVKINNRAYQTLVNFQGHRGNVNNVEFHPEQEVVCTGGVDKTVRLINCRTGEVLANLTGHQGKIEDIAVSSNGELIASASGDKSVRLWSWKSKELVTTFTSADKPANEVEFHPSQDVIAINLGGKRDKEVLVWDFKRGEEVSKLKVNLASAIGFHPDGRLLVVADKLNSTNHYRLVFFDWQTGKVVSALQGHRSSIVDIDFISSKSLLSFGSKGEVKLWGLEQNMQLMSIDLHEGLSSGTYDRTTNTILAGTNNGKIIQISPATTKPIVLNAGSNFLDSISFAKDGKTLMAKDLTGQIFAWEIPSLKAIEPSADEETRWHENLTENGWYACPFGNSVLLLKTK